MKLLKCFLRLFVDSGGDRRRGCGRVLGVAGV